MRKAFCYAPCGKGNNNEEQEMSRGALAQVLKLGLLLMLVFVVSGCGGGGSGAGGGGGGEAKEAKEAKPRTVPEYGDLRPGTYVTDEFRPAFSFEIVDEGWVVGGAEERGVLDMRQGVEGGVLSFVNEKEVFDPSKLRDMDSVPAPKNLVSWLQKHPYLETEQPEPVTIGGVKGVQLDAVVAEDVPTSECGDNCLGLLMVTLEIAWVVYEKEKVRFIVLEDVGGERVTIGVEALAVDFEEFLPRAQKVIDTVEWKGT
jgi:hypothetical protein